MRRIERRKIKGVREDVYEEELAGSEMNCAVCERNRKAGGGETRGEDEKPQGGQTLPRTSHQVAPLTQDSLVAVQGWVREG